MVSSQAAPFSPLAGSRERLWPLVAVSLSVHVAFIAIAAFRRSEPLVDLSQKPIQAKLVRLGEKRPEQFLPRKDEPPPAPAAERVAVPVPGAPAAAPAASKPGPKESKDAADPLASILKRVRAEQKKMKNEPVYGDPTGDPEGDSSEGSEGERYLALVDHALHENYRLPSTISEQDRLYLKATIVLFIEADGSLSHYTYEKRSGNPTFDDALERAVQEARLPPPPAELRGRLKKIGLGVHFHM
jgi:colicin import membrane protein